MTTTILLLVIAVGSSFVVAAWALRVARRAEANLERLHGWVEAVDARNDNLAYRMSVQQVDRARQMMAATGIAFDAEAVDN